MDSTGGDLAHAAKEIEEKVEERSLHSLEHEKSSRNVVGEKHEEEINSSGSSSRDSLAVEKLDSVIKVRDVKDGDAAYAHLPEHEREIVKRQLEIPPIKVSFLTLYRYATRNDILIIAISALCSIIGGAVMPLMTVGDEHTLPYRGPPRIVC